jgi:hypothetical protein
MHCIDLERCNAIAQPALHVPATLKVDQIHDNHCFRYLIHVYFCCCYYFLIELPLILPVVDAGPAFTTAMDGLE